MKSKIKNYQDACAFLKQDPDQRPDNSKLEKDDQEYMNAHWELMIIARARNTEATGKRFEPDFTNSNERKYHAAWGVEADPDRPSGFGFSYTNCDLWFTGTSVGSRFCFPNSEMALDYAENHTELHLVNQLSR